VATEPASTSISIHQEVDLKATPQRIYEALLDAKQFSAFSLLPAEIRREAGGGFSCFGGHIVGRNVELVPNQRIVQAWRVVTWPEGAYSIAKFELKAQGSGTRLILDHVGFPEGLKEHLATGWKEHYWERLQKYFSYEESPVVEMLALEREAWGQVDRIEDFRWRRAVLPWPGHEHHESRTNSRPSSSSGRSVATATRLTTPMTRKAHTVRQTSKLDRRD
jgi:uncharacterized protein YndB with AHSA1/START domain